MSCKLSYYFRNIAILVLLGNTGFHNSKVALFLAYFRFILNVYESVKKVIYSIETERKLRKQ